MRLIFFGTSHFAVPSLEKLTSSGFDVAAVVTAPDKRGGRGRKQLLASSVKKSALKLGLKCLQPPNLKAPEFLEELQNLNAEIFVVVAFRMLPKAVWDMPEKGTVNLHASLLPAYRGAAPIHHAVMNGEKETGLTVFQLRHEIDTGDILAQKKIGILPDETTGELHDRMALAGADLLVDTMRLLKSGDVKPVAQDPEKVSSAPKISRETGEIDFSKGKTRVYNLIRGLNPFPGAYTALDGKKLKIWRAVLPNKDERHINEGKIVSDGKNYLKIGTGDGFINCTEVQPEGKKRMKIEEFLNGYGSNLPKRVG